MTMKDELPRSVGTQYATGEEWRNNSRKNEETEQNLECQSMNQGKWEVVKQEMERENIDILPISELKQTGMGKFNSDYH